MEDNVQLREEEIVGDEVVLSDIYPKTNTSSVVDDISGTTLNETLDRIQEKINNKLSRVVNSVNGRTGVVVLDSEDVGLGNVDNVSFSDIKGWVINLLVSEFANKRIALLNSLDEADAIANENKEANRDRPFFAQSGYLNLRDKKSYIGYFYYDDSVKKLKITYRSINTIGSTDGSLIYDTSVGNLMVRIKSTEKALRVSQDLSDPGLYIDKSNVMPTIRYFDGVWGRIDSNYTPDVDQTDTPSGSTNNTEYKYRTAIKGFCPDTTVELAAESCQHVIIRFHSDNYKLCRDEYDNYMDDSSHPRGDLYEGYYIGDRAFDEHQDGSINFATYKSGSSTGPSTYEIYPYKKEGQFDPSVILYGERPQGLYKLHTEESTTQISSRNLYNKEYVILRTELGTLTPNEVIYCAFRSPIDNEGKQIHDGERYRPGGINLETLEFLTNRTPAYGIVHSYQNTDPSRLVVIEFYEQEIHPGWSLEYSGKTGTKSLEVKVSKAKVPTTSAGGLLEWNNFSGLQTISANNYDDAVIGSDGYKKLMTEPTNWSYNWMNYYEYDAIGGTYTLLGDIYPNMTETIGLCGYFKIEKRYLRSKKYAEFVTTGKYAPTVGQRSEISPNEDELPPIDNIYTQDENKFNQFLNLMKYEAFLEEPRQFNVDYVWGGKEISEIGNVDTGDRNLENYYEYAKKLMTYSVFYTDEFTPVYAPECYKNYQYITKTIYDEAKTAIPFKRTTTVAGQTVTELNEYYEYVNGLIDRHRYMMLPSGPTKVYDNDYSRTGGLFINPDASLCIIPKQLCFFDSGQDNSNYEDWPDLSEILNNWRPSLPKTRYSASSTNHKNPDIEPNTSSETNGSKGMKDDDCYIGINLMKGLKWYPGRFSYRKLTQKPDNWDVNDGYKNYYYESDAYDPPQYMHVEGVPSDSSSANTLVAPDFDTGTYYELIDGATPNHMTGNKYYSYNLSGLRVIGNYDDFDQTKVDYSWIGMNYGEYESRYKIDTTKERNLDFNVTGGIMHSGGLSVNVGQFLEIDPGRYDRNYTNWYDHGKINVRIGKGLQEEPITYDSQNRQITGNRIQLALDSESGFNFNSDGQLTLKNVKITTLDFVDTYDTHFLYDPLPEFPFKSSTSYNNVTFQIGRGLKLVTDETRARDFDSLMDSMTVVQLEIFLDCADEQIGHINQKIAKRKSLCKKDDVALAADTEAIKRVQAYHPAREKDTDLPYYWLSLNDMIQWAIDNNVEGVGSDDHGPTSENSTSIPRDIASMSLRTFKDNVAYRWINMVQSDMLDRADCYRDETLKMITPYTEENTAPLAVMLTYYSTSDLDETPYDSVVRKAHLKVSDLCRDYFTEADDPKHDWVTHPITYNETTYSSPIPLIQDICKDIRKAFANTALNPKSFDDKLSDDESLHISADSLSELWLDIVEHGGASKSGYHTAQQWLDDSSIGLTKKDIVNSIDALADMDDYGWRERAKIFKERLHGDDVQNVVTVRDTAGLVVHKISLAYLKLVENKTETISSTDITKTTYKQLTSATPPDDWNNAESLNKYCVKYIPTKAYSAYEANKYYRATATSFEVVGTAPTLWDKSCFKFYEKSNNYKHLAKGTAFVQNTYYKMTEVSFTKLTSSTFDDETYVGTGDNYAVFPPTDDDWTGKAVNDQTTTTTSDVATGNMESTVGSYSGAYREQGYSRVQADVQYTYNDNGSVVATLTPNISSTDISAATTDATKLNNWKNTWPQYWTEAPLPYPTLAQAGYTKMPYYVKGMFYEKQEPTGTQEVQVLTDIVSISDTKLTKDEYTQNRSVSPSPNWEPNTYYSKTDTYEYLAIYEEPSDWASMNWSRDNNKYYNYKYQLITTNPGGFLPNLYYTRRPKTEYNVLTEKPVDWDTPEGYQKYYTRTAGSQVKIRTDVTNATWLDNGERLTPAEQYNTWVVVKTDENVHAGLDGFVGEDLNTLMLYVLGRKWSMKEMLSRASSESAWITWTKDIKDEEESSST